MRLVTLFLVGCASAHDPAPRDLEATMTEPVPLVEDWSDAQAASGSLVRVRGTAYDAKLSAIVVSDGISVYCLDIEEWPSGLTGQSIEVTGRLRNTDQFKARVDADGGISQGTTGGDWVMEGCIFQVSGE